MADTPRRNRVTYSFPYRFPYDTYRGVLGQHQGYVQRVLAHGEGEKMSELESRTVWLGAFRYYIGRMTHAVDDFCDALVVAWPTLPAITRSIISRELEKAFAQDDEARNEGRNWTPLGAACDRQSWEKVRRLYSCS